MYSGSQHNNFIRISSIQGFYKQRNPHKNIHLCRIRETYEHTTVVGKLAQYIQQQRCVINILS